MTIVSVYKPQPTPFYWPPSAKLDTNQTTRPTLIIGDFNSHNTIWGYDENDKDGEAVEEWATSNNLTLLHNQKDSPSFMSARWKKGYNPDLVFISAQHSTCFEKIIGEPIPKSQHSPITINIRPIVRALESKCIPRFNSKKANWSEFNSDLGREITLIVPKLINYEI